MKTTQYTIRRVSPVVDKKLRRLARASNRSLNEVALEALQSGLNIQPQELVAPENSLNGLASFDQAAKRASTFDPNQSIKQLYSESIAKQHNTN